MRFISTTIALDIENVRLHRVAVTDPLTGAYNREFLQQRLPQEIEAAIDRDRPLSVAIVDVDHFKAVNDQYGHGVGDVVLAEVARRLRSAIRGGDLLVRYGGEEFLAVLPKADAGRAWEVGERMRQRVCERAFDVGDGLALLLRDLRRHRAVADGRDDARSDRARRRRAVRREAARPQSRRGRAVTDEPDDPTFPPPLVREPKPAPAGPPEPPPPPPLDHPFAPPPPPPPIEPLLPPAIDLQAAVGAPMRPSLSRDPAPEAAPDRPGGRRWTVVLAFGIAAAVLIGTFVVLGYVNAQRYAIACEAKQVIAQQGRSFPPWGMRQLSGDEWRPIAIEAASECTANTTENVEELEKWYLDALVEQASALLSGREVTKFDVASAQLDQALLLARSPARRDERKAIERLQGDVDYWRASAKLREAATALGDAANQFEAASNKHPRHVNDASLWATFLRKLAEQLHGGPNGGAPTTVPVTTSGVQKTGAPPGVALPVEPTTVVEPPPLAPDAGVASGGVLL